MRDDVIPEHEIRAAVRDHLTPDRHGPRGEGVDALVADVAGVLDHQDDDDMPPNPSRVAPGAPAWVFPAMAAVVAAMLIYIVVISW